jgi:hypothetical protein
MCFFRFSRLFQSCSDENALTAEQMQNIIEYLPTSEERKALEGYMLEGGEDAAEKFDGLCETEKFMVSMMTVRHAKRKVRALLFKLQFDSCLRELEKGTFLLFSGVLILVVRHRSHHLRQRLLFKQMRRWLSLLVTS